jgi:hypothetical protein
MTNCALVGAITMPCTASDEQLNIGEKVETRAIEKSETRRSVITLEYFGMLRMLRRLSGRQRSLEVSELGIGQLIPAFLLALLLPFVAQPQILIAQDQQTPAQANPPYAQQTPEQLRQLVAPLPFIPTHLSRK